jgi:Rod binding domain-containing protein
VNPLSSLPAVPETALPASVRSGSAQDKQDYAAALGFEQVLLKQVVSAIVPADSELADSPYASAVQDAFAQGLTDSGGIGLGAQLFETMQRTRS